MNNFPSLEFAKWMLYGAAAYLGFTMVRFLVALALEYIEEQAEQAAALAEIESMTYFPRLRHVPENLRRFATVHNMRLLDVLDLGPDEESGDNYYYMHGQVLPGLCGSMLVKQTRAGDVYNLNFERNRVAAALVAKCEGYVHNITLTHMLSMFVARVMTSHDKTDNRESVSNDICEVSASYGVPFGMDAAILSTKLIKAGARIVDSKPDNIDVVWYSKKHMLTFNNTTLTPDYASDTQEQGE